MKRSIILSLSLILTLGIGAQSYKQYNDICYTVKTDTYSQEEAENLPVVAWFHGGGLEQGEKEIPWWTYADQCPGFSSSQPESSIVAWTKCIREVGKNRDRQ